MGFFILLLLWLFFWMLMTAFVSYVMDSSYLTSWYMRRGEKPTILCWLPFYGQYQLGKIAGAGWAGGVLVLCHVMTLMCILNVWVDLPVEVTGIVNRLFYAALFFGFALKEWIVQWLIGRHTGKWRLLILFADVVTLGMTRSIILFFLRKRVKFQK